MNVIAKTVEQILTVVVMVPVLHQKMAVGQKKMQINEAVSNTVYSVTCPTCDQPPGLLCKRTDYNREKGLTFLVHYSRVYLANGKPEKIVYKNTHRRGVI